MMMMRNIISGGKVVYLMGNNAHQFQGQTSRSPGRLMLMRNIFRTGRPTPYERQTIGTQTDHEDPHQQQHRDLQGRRSRSQGRSRDASNRCWQISRERNILADLATQKFVGRLSTPPAIMRKIIQGQARLPLRLKVCHSLYLHGRRFLFNIGGTTNRGAEGAEVERRRRENREFFIPSPPLPSPPLPSIPLRSRPPYCG